MHAMDLLGSASRSFVGRQPPLAFASDSLAPGLGALPRAGGQGSAGRDLLLSLLSALAGLMAAAVLAPVGGWAALAVGLLAFVLMLLAIGRWIRLQRRIQSVATEWQLTIDAVDSPILTLDLEGRILRMNHAAMLLSGRPYRDNLGKQIGDLGPGEPWRTASEQVDLARTGVAPPAVTVEDSATGESWEITVPRVQAPGGARPTVVVVALNVTELVSLQESLHRQELLSAMGSLVAGVAHDMRNFLFSINGTVDVLESRFGDREDQLPLIHLLREKGDQMSDLMQTLLDYGKPLELSRRPESLDDVIEEAHRTCSELAAEKGVELAVKTNGYVPQIRLDRTRMLQVFKNLMENAVQHSPRGGRVEVDTHLAGGTLECRVRDSGSGFEPAHAGRLFEPFFSQRHGGTGLGLAIAQRVVDEHGGEIEAANRPGGGAVFRVRFPVNVAGG